MHPRVEAFMKKLKAKYLKVQEPIKVKQRMVLREI